MKHLEFDPIDVAWELVQDYKDRAQKQRGFYVYLSDLLYGILASLEDDHDTKSYINELVVTVFDSGHQKNDTIFDTDPHAWYCSRPARIRDWKIINGEVVVYYSFVIDKYHNMEASVFHGTKEDDSLFDESTTMFLLDMLYEFIKSKINKK